MKALAFMAVLSVLFGILVGLLSLLSESFPATLLVAAIGYIGVYIANKENT